MSDVSPLDTAVEAARRGAALLMDSFGGPIAFQEKSSRNFVTPLDVQAEALILETLRRSFPDHSILAEEVGALPGCDQWRWIVDPLSSTRNYLHGMPHWAVCLALERQGTPILAVVLDPTGGELFAAEVGRGTTCNGAPQAVSTVSTLERAMVCATFNVEGERGGGGTLEEGLAFYGRLARYADLRSLGSAGLHLAFVAAGRLDAFVTNDADPFATVAGALLVHEAGGVVTDFSGKEWVPSSPEMVASNGRFHQQLLETVRGASSHL